MTGEGSSIRSTSRSRGDVTTLKAAAGRLLRSLMPPVTPRVILRVLLGLLLFFGGIIFGAWLIIRSRRHLQT